MKKVLILLTNHATLGEAKEANGTYAPELTHVLHELMEAKIDFDLASLEGGSVPLYGTDMEGDAVNQKLLANDKVTSGLENSLRIDHLSPEDYDAVFYPGGFGLLYDLAQSEKAGQFAATIYEKGGVLSAVCHGPAGLLPIKLTDGTPLLKAFTVTGFTHEEEKDFGTIEKIPYLLEESLTRAADQFHKKGPWQPFVVEQDRLITGQNPQSATGVGQALVRQLQAR